MLRITVAPLESYFNSHPPFLEDRGCFEKDRIALRRGLSEFGRTALVGQLEGAEGRFITIHEDRLDILPVDGCVGLEEHAKVYDGGVCNVEATFNLGDARLFLKGRINKKDRATCGDARRVMVDFTDLAVGSPPASQDGETVEATFFKVNDVENVIVMDGTVMRTAVIGGAGCPHQLLFNPGQDAQSDSVEVTKNGDGTWTVRTQPAPNDVAVCIPNEDKGNPPPRSYYHMPFEVTVTLKP